MTEIIYSVNKNKTATVRCAVSEQVANVGSPK